MTPRYAPRSSFRTHLSAVEHPALREHVLVALDPGALDAALAARRRRGAPARSALAAAAPWVLAGALALGAIVGALVGALV